MQVETPIKSKSVGSKPKAELELIFLSLATPRRNGGLPITFEREYKFHDARKWRFDYALPAIKVAVEHEGLPLQTDKSRHTTIKGFAGDCEKYSEAAILGWCVIRVNALSLKSGLAHDLIKRAVDARRIMINELPGARRNRLAC